MIELRWPPCTHQYCANVSFSWGECTRGATLLSGVATSQSACLLALGQSPHFSTPLPTLGWNRFINYPKLMCVMLSHCCFMCKFDHSCERVRIFLYIYWPWRFPPLGKLVLSCYFSHIPTGFVFLNKNSLWFKTDILSLLGLQNLFLFFMIFPASWHESLFF